MRALRKLHLIAWLMERRNPRAGPGDCMDNSLYQFLSALLHLFRRRHWPFLNVHLPAPRDLWSSTAPLLLPGCEADPLASKFAADQLLLLRGRCANHGSKIAFRYLAVSCLPHCSSGDLANLSWQMAMAYWIISLVIVATFVDFEHFIIPTR